MFSFVGTIFFICFAILMMGFIDLFVKEPNQCEMTYMYQMPDYVEINTAKHIRRMFPKYRLYVYGEGQYTDTLRLNEFNGNPVLFIPGNAGSYKQVRSLASVALLMSFKRHSHLNYFSIDFNEELSAFIGERLEFQTKYLFYSIKRIIELYSHVPNIRIILVGHSVGGILIKSLLTKPYFKPFLEKVSLIITLATPQIHPVISYDMKTLSLYKQINDNFKQYRHSDLANVNFISIGGSYQDNIIRSDLIDLDSNYEFDRSLLSTEIPDVWVSADHLCIVWCRQLIIKLNRMIFDLIDQNESVFIESANVRQKIIDYHLIERHLSQEYPNFIISNITKYSGNMEWVELKDRLIRLTHLKVVRPNNYIIRLMEHETIIVNIDGMLKHDSIGACKSHSDNFTCQENILNLYNHMHLIPAATNSKLDRHLGHFQADELLSEGYTHLIIHLGISQSSYNILIDRFKTQNRQRNIILPSLFQSLISVKNIYEPKLIFSKLFSQEHLYFELTIDNFNYIWDCYWFVIQTTSCYQNNSSFIGFIRLHYPGQTLNEHYWPIQHRKGQQYQFILARNKNNEIIGQLKNNSHLAKIFVYLEPNCGFDMLVKYSFSSSIAQLLKHYFTILIPMMVSTIILLLSIQFSNVCNRYTFSSFELERFKNHYSKQSANQQQQSLRDIKCYMFMKPSEIMINYHYFSYCLVQIVPASMLALFIIKSFYPHHDLISLSNLALEQRCCICTLLFLFGYSVIYICIILVNHLANNFANGLIFFGIRFKIQRMFSCLSNFGCCWTIFNAGHHWSLWQFIKLKIVLLFNVALSFVFIYSYIYFMPLTYFLVHFSFTLLMLYWFVKSKSLELRIGQTTITSMVYCIYPILFCLLLGLTLIHLPLCLDWIFTKTNWLSMPHQTIRPAQTSFGLNYIGKMMLIGFQNLDWKECLQLSLVLMVIYYIYKKPLNLIVRLKHYQLTRRQQMLNILLLMVAFINMLMGTLSIENVNISIVTTILAIMGHLHYIFNNNNIINNIKENYNKSD